MNSWDILFTLMFSDNILLIKKLRQSYCHQYSLCDYGHFNTLALELDIEIVAHHLCKMWIFYEPKK